MGKHKSQVDAPIELVIAVIILLTSISISLLIFGNTSEQQCLSELKGEIQKLQLAMQDLALQSPPASRTIDFSLPRCGSRQVDALRFIYFSDPQYFCRKCPGHFEGCWILQPASFNVEAGRYEPLSEQEICVDISGEFIIDQPTDPVCKTLSSNPCPPQSDGDTDPYCNKDISGIATQVYNYNDKLNSPSRFSTLSTSESNYRITLRKNIGTIGTCVNCPKFDICAVSPGV